MSMKRAVSCGRCGRLFSEGEEAWAEDWKVCDAPEWKWRWETRYLCDDCHDKAEGSVVSADDQRGLDESPITYGLCLHCQSIEVALNKPTGTRDLSSIGESDSYPTGYGCELCA